MRYRVRHSTEYRYSAQVINGHTVAHLRPRLTTTQTVRESEVTTVPAADHADEYLDVFGNHVSYRAVEQVHDQLVVVAQSEVDITPPVELLWSPPWEEVRSIVATDGSPDGLLARMCSIESTLVTPSADLAR
ncbi:MAG: transglutaminase N-terminal domain-containing protein, partial [Ilumatobacteraceae bacterium]